MKTLKDKVAVVTGGSRGIGLGIVEALVERGARVCVVARDADRLAQVGKRLGVDTRRGDVTDETFARSTLADLRPDVLVLNAGAEPKQGAIHEIGWDAFDQIWNTDVKAGFFWTKAALTLPLAKGSRVILGSSGAAVRGSPMSGGYAGAKRMLWLMAQYANVSSGELGLGVHFQALVPQQIIGGTGVGGVGAAAYSKKKGVSVEEFLKSFGKPLTPRDIGEHVVTILTDERYEKGVAFGVTGDTGITSLDG
jgi:NAD(P)-dependent dehydrogenase (short-subunit alcohol dehydrogenase family)